MLAAKSDAPVLEGLPGLRAPFAREVIGLLPKVTCQACSKSPTKECGSHRRSKCTQCDNYITSAHIHLDYVGHAAVTDRLLTIDPAWSWEPVAVDPNTGMPLLDGKGNLWIRLTVLGVTRYGVGDGSSLKETIGDAIRNAAMRFGVALELWTKDELESEVVSASANEPTKEQPAGLITDEQRHRLWDAAKAVGLGDMSRLGEYVQMVVGHPVESMSALTVEDAEAVIVALLAMAPSSDVEAAQAEVRQLGDELRELRQDSAPVERAKPPERRGETVSIRQKGTLMAHFTRLQILNREERLEYIGRFIGRPIESSSDLTMSEASRMIDHLVGLPDPVAAAAAVAADAIEVEDYPDPDPDQYGSP